PRDPHARTNPLEDYIARHFEKEATDDKHSRSDAVNRVTEFEVADHLQLCEADVHAAEEGNDVAEGQERNKAGRHLLVRGFFELRRHGRRHRCLLPRSLRPEPALSTASGRDGTPGPGFMASQTC